MCDKKEEGRKAFFAPFFKISSYFTHKYFKKLSLKLHKKLKIFARQPGFNKATPRRTNAKFKKRKN